MQAFYPAPPRHNPLLVLLGLFVVLLHGLGLQGLSDAWPTSAARLTPPTIQIQMNNLDLAQGPPSIVSPPPSARAKSPAKSSSSTSTTWSSNANAPATAPSEQPAGGVATPTTDLPAAVQPHPAPSPEPAAEASAPLPQSPPPLPSAPSPASAEPAQAGARTPGLSDATFMFPTPTKLLFDVVGESKGIRYAAEGDLWWQHDGHNYQMRQEVRHLLLGARTQNSTGQLSAQGLQPLRFGDKYKQEQAAHFEREKSIISFSNNANSQPLQEGAQDRLSLLAQLASVMAGTPSLRQHGQQFQLQVASTRSADVWVFVVEKTETLKLPIGTLLSLKLSRQPSQPYEQTIEVWLSPAHGYLPAKVRIAQSNGDSLEQLLRKAERP